MAYRYGDEPDSKRQTGNKTEMNNHECDHGRIWLTTHKRALS